MLKDLHPFERYPHNPILETDDVPYLCNTVFNAAACKCEGRYLLLLRIEDLRGRSHLTLAVSEDGYHFKIEDSPWSNIATAETKKGLCSALPSCRLPAS